MARKRLIVGLGNPGSEYEATRHNVGFMVVDHLAEKVGVAPLRRNLAASFADEASHRGRALVLAKPQTYMNRSGEAVRALTRRYGLTPDDLIVVYDDLALPLGAVRLRGKGGAGGHNGIQDIIDVLGTSAFPRIRVGIGSDFGRGQQVRYVLAPFGADETDARDEAVAFAAKAALSFVRDGLMTAMNRYNRKAAPTKSPSETKATSKTAAPSSSESTPHRGEAP
ncbi:MAG: aminoacyl-tRNA hydrolase [Bacteroidota bacterium]